MKVLADIEMAQTLKSETERSQEEIETVPHPLDQDYNSIKCNLSLVDKKSQPFKVSAVRREARGMQGSSNNSLTAIPRMRAGDPDVHENDFGILQETKNSQRVGSRQGNGGNISGESCFV